MSEMRIQQDCFRPAAICRYGNAGVIIFLALYFFFIPFGLMICYLTDPGLRGEGIPRLALHLHRRLSPKYEKWARHRIASGRARELDIEDIAGTEWPVFGSAFYLWATESIQQAWEKDKSILPTAPGVYAAGAIEAATGLVTDPNHASWVKEHWGQNYLHQENVFYRMLIISAATSYHTLLGGEKYLSLLRDQVETLSEELDESPLGLLDDYPKQCYPTDVVAAIAAINRAGAVLGMDYSAFVKRSIRGFQGQLVDSTGLPPYNADSTACCIGIARGCSSQWGLVWAPQLWPETAKTWYQSFEEHFWQKRWTAVGFREFARGTTDSDWYIDVDSGPVIAGFGAAASAFGLGAARANGRFDHAYPLSAELIAMVWPLADGTLFIPRILSNATDAPYLGEAAILFTLTRMPAEGTEIKPASNLPGCVYWVLIAFLAAGILPVLASLAALRSWRKRTLPGSAPFARTQLALWVILVVAGIVVGFTHSMILGLLLLLLGQFLPRGERKTASVPAGKGKDFGKKPRGTNCRSG
jgi:hypothetical protein